LKESDEKIALKQLKKYFRSYDLAKLSDFIFSETISNDDFKIKNKEVFVIDKSNELITYINPTFSLSDGDIVFTKTDYVKSLFKLLQDCSLKNLTLITHQSDIEINKRIYSKKPKAISRWFSVNVSIEKDDLFSIPIGFANEHYKKNLNPDYLSEKSKIDEKINKVYINFNPNTNYLERIKIFNTYSHNSDFVISTNNQKMSNYKDDLEKYKYVLCPPGNGIQTHRLWESIYYGAIPVVKDSILYKNFKKLNIIFVEDFKNLNLSNLLQKSNKTFLRYEDFFENNYKIIFNKDNNYKKNTQNFRVSELTLNILKRKHLLFSRFNKIYKPLRSKILKFYNIFLLNF